MGADGSDQRYLTAGGEPQWEPGYWIVFDWALQDPKQPGQVCVVRTAPSSLACRSVARRPSQTGCRDASDLHADGLWIASLPVMRTPAEASSRSVLWYVQARGANDVSAAQAHAHRHR